MRERRIVFVIVGLLAGALAVWLWQRGNPSDTDATQQATQGQGSTGSSLAITPVVVRASASIEVTVRDAKGPLVGASVRIAPEDGDVIVIKTDSTGVATAKSLVGGTYEISASAIDFEPAALPTHELRSDDNAKLAITLVAGGRTLAGTVTDVSGGPIGGVRIDAAKLGGLARPSSAVATTVTGGDGRYRLTVGEGQLLVGARSPDYAAQSRYVDVGSSGATADFSLVPGGVIEGIVLDEKSKQPIGGAIVVARRDSAAMMLVESGGHRGIAGVDGRFRLSGLRPGAYELDARGAGNHSRTPTRVGLGVAEQLTGVQILVGRGAVIRGKVIDEAGAPVANAEVFNLGEDRGGDEVKSDAKGAFVIEGASLGKHMLLARTDDHVSAGLANVELKDTDIEGIVLRVERGLKLRGRVEPRQVAEVTFDTGEAGADMTRLVMVAPTTTGADGVFEIGPVLAGKGTVSARCASGDQGSLEVSVAAGMPEVILKVTPGASIAGRIVDGDGKPVGGASVMANPTGGTERTVIVNGMVTSGIQTVSSTTGAFEIKGLSSGAYRLGALDRGRPLRLRKAAPVVKLAAAEKKTGVELAVDRPNGVIKGIVTGPDGKPLADAWVSAQQDFGSMIEGAMQPRGEESEGSMSRMVMVREEDDGTGSAASSSAPPALTDAQGRFEITGLAHSTYDVIAEAQAGKLRGRAEAVKPDATVNLQALGVTSLSGTVRSAAGPVPLFTIELDGPTRTSRSFIDGTFELGRVDAGTYTVRVTSAAGNGEAKVTVAPNTPATISITLVANAVIVGTVIGADGTPVADVGVMAIDDSGDGKVKISMSGMPPTTGPDGKFRIEHKAGAATLVVMTQPRPITRRGLALEAGKTLDVGAIRVEEPPPKP